MKNHPPAIATWLLEHLTRGSQREALTGDLREEFIHRASARWYWRQVVRAIALSAAQTARAEWFVVFFAAAWTLLVASLWARLMTHSKFQSLVGLGVGWNWPYSLLYYVAVFTTATVLTLWMGLTLYLVITRRFDSRSLLHGMAVASILDVATNAASLFFAGRYRVGIYLIAWMPLFLTLLISIYVGRKVKPQNQSLIPG
jgi:hypothetical protein